VRRILTQNLSISVGRDDDDLLATGALDSMNLVRLITQLELEFELDMSLMDEGLDSFRSIAAIARMVEEKERIASGGHPVPYIAGRRDALAARITNVLASRLSIFPDTPETDLYDSGQLDSLVLVRLILELEQEFEIALPIGDLDLITFRSVVSMADLISARTSTGMVA